MTIAVASPSLAPRSGGVTLGQVQTLAVWLMLATSFFVKIEPAICDALFVLVLVLHITSGIALNKSVIPMITYLFFYNFGAFLSSLQLVGDQNIVTMFIVTSTYMATTAIFFAFYVAYDPLPRLAVIKNAWIVAATIASILGLLGYFNIAGLGGALSFNQRAVATFKDPNVFATFLIFPCLLILQGFLLGTQRNRFFSAIALLLILAAIFLAFSRGAWISFVSASILIVGFSFILAPSNKLRSRIIILSVIGLIVTAIMLLLLLSIDDVRNLFLDRFTLVKNYDAGETGRFGNQLNSIPMLLERPLGFGPLQFFKYFGLDPHNTFINSFASYGWLGGFSYFLLIFSTIYIGLKTVLTHTPWQNHAIVVFCPLLTTILQGVQIDTDHWRHFYVLLGLMWGLFAASALPMLSHNAMPIEKNKLDLWG